MKKTILYIALCVATLLSLAACKKSEKPLDITGEWNLTKVETKSATIGSEKVDVYISFMADKTFTMYQMIGAGRYKMFSGTWSLSGTTLSGKYSGGVSWDSSYEVALSGSTMTLTSGSEIDTFTKTTIPDQVIMEAQ